MKSSKKTMSKKPKMGMGGSSKSMKKYQSGGSIKDAIKSAAGKATDFINKNKPAIKSAVGAAEKAIKNRVGSTDSGMRDMLKKRNITPYVPADAVQPMKKGGSVKIKKKK